MDSNLIPVGLLHFCLDLSVHVCLCMCELLHLKYPELPGKWSHYINFSCNLKLIMKSLGVRTA